MIESTRPPRKRVKHSVSAESLVNATPEPAARQRRLRSIIDRAPGTLVVHEIYRSLQGEGTHAGLPCVFIRLTGCHLRCGYCDTRHAFHEGEVFEIGEVLRRVKAMLRPGDLIELTGGEPLLHDEAIPLLAKLADTGHLVLLETSGAIDTAPVDLRVRVILDVKTPGSGEAEANHWPNLHRMREVDEVKFVVVDRPDFDWSLDVVRRQGLAFRCPVLIAPAHGRVEPRDLAEWVLASGLPLRFQLQLHKEVWGAKTRGV